jgi:hypothetical protein
MAITFPPSSISMSWLTEISVLDVPGFHVTFSPGRMIVDLEAFRELPNASLERVAQFTRTFEGAELTAFLAAWTAQAVAENSVVKGLRKALLARLTLDGAIPPGAVLEP